MSNITRRAIMGATAAVAASTAFPVAANGIGADDPIYSAIEAHRAAQARVDEAASSSIGETPEEEMAHEEAFNALCDAAWEAAWPLLDNDATTVAGVAALLAYIQEKADVLDFGRARMDDEIGIGGVSFQRDAIAWAARSLKRLAGERVS